MDDPGVLHHIVIRGIEGKGISDFRAGIVEDVTPLKVFPFTGHSALMGKKIRT
jgi:hypothetical protein